jgi:hypothetical protein
MISTSQTATGVIVGGLAVAEKSKPARGHAPDEEFSTFRIYAADGDVLSELAKLSGMTVADAYRAFLASIAKKERVRVLEEKLKQAKQ